jgi:hypothetical protein
MQPFNYQQNVVNPFEQALGSAVKAFQAGSTVRAAQQEQQAAQEAERRRQEMLQRFAEFQAKPNKTIQDYQSMAMLLPEKQGQNLLNFYKQESEEKQTDQKKFAGQVASSLLSTTPESRQIGINMLRRRAEAARNAGNIEEAEADETYAKLAETDPEGAKAVADQIMIYGTYVFGKDWGEGVLKVTQGPEQGFRPVTEAERKTYGLPAGVPFQVGPKGEIKEVTRGPLVKVDTGKGDTLALKELDLPRAKEFSDAAASARKLANDTRVINNLLKGAGGGRVVKLTTELARDFGFDSDTVAANDLANSLATRGAVQIRAPGSGATSDLEFRSYLQAFPSLANSERGRQIMSKYAEVFAKRSARLADHARKLIREDRYTEEEIARFDESLGPLLGEDFYEFARPSRRPGVPAYQGQPRPAADGSVRSRADAIIKGQ